MPPLPPRVTLQPADGPVSIEARQEFTVGTPARAVRFAAGLADDEVGADCHLAIGQPFAAV